MFLGAAATPFLPTALQLHFELPLPPPARGGHGVRANTEPTELLETLPLRRFRFVLFFS